MVSVFLPSDALLQQLPSYLGFSYLGRGVSLHSCSIKAQLLLLTFDEGYPLTTAIPDLHHGIAPLHPPVKNDPFYKTSLNIWKFTVHILLKPGLKNFQQAGAGGPRGATPRSRSGGGDSEEIPLVQGKEQQLHFAGAAVKRYPTSKVRETK